MENKSITREDVMNMREAMGTLPSQAPEKTYVYKNDISSIKINMTDWPKNPYKEITRAVCATWGDNETGSMGKWEKLKPENRYRCVLACMTGQTLPQAQEAVNFQFEVNGLSRSDFDQHARARVGAHFMSIGTRDNNKLDADFLLYDDVMQRVEKDPAYKAKVEHWVRITKDLYEETIKDDNASWQSGRCFLPQSLNHSYVFGINLIALKGQMARRLMACEQEGIVSLHWHMRKCVEEQFPFLAAFLKPQCDGAKKCIYMSGAEGLTALFSNLFDGCGRWPVTREQDKVYHQFNKSCTSYERLKELGVPVLSPTEYPSFGFNDYEYLSNADRKLFEEA